jgi:hypothetical protein
MTKPTVYTEQPVASITQTGGTVERQAIAAATLAMILTFDATRTNLMQMVPWKGGSGVMDWRGSDPFNTSWHLVPYEQYVNMTTVGPARWIGSPKPAFMLSFYHPAYYATPDMIVNNMCGAITFTVTNRVAYDAYLITYCAWTPTVWSKVAFDWSADTLEIVHPHVQKYYEPKVALPPDLKYVGQYTVGWIYTGTSMTLMVLGGQTVRGIQRWDFTTEPGGEVQTDPPETKGVFDIDGCNIDVHEMRMFSPAQSATTFQKTMGAMDSRWLAMPPTP